MMDLIKPAQGSPNWNYLWQLVDQLQFEIEQLHREIDEIKGEQHG